MQSKPPVEHRTFFPSSYTMKRAALLVWNRLVAIILGTRAARKASPAVMYGELWPLSRSFGASQM